MKNWRTLLVVYIVSSFVVFGLYQTTVGAQPFGGGSAAGNFLGSFIVGLIPTGIMFLYGATIIGTVKRVSFIPPAPPTAPLSHRLRRTATDVWIKISLLGVLPWFVINQVIWRTGSSSLAARNPFMASAFGAIYGAILAVGVFLAVLVLIWLVFFLIEVINTLRGK